MCAFALRVRRDRLHVTTGSPIRSRRSALRAKVERETGIEPATNSLEGCDSTTELLPPSCTRYAPHFGGPARLCALFASPSRLRRFGTTTFAFSLPRQPSRLVSVRPPSPSGLRWTTLSACPSRVAAKVGGEGRTRTFEAARATDLQSAAFDRFATSPAICC